ncbi:hypothetical protein Suden_2097 [Sulfurimonas denitrificans DSM 1251]|uniref:Uncharacterized protein n=1 Tax=Sulfurimonas denitrificans (strain ATCC 33889 / DSM 1251) TaxID=326298 RepID=Q30NR0_SULDN|nr:hypothetical protein [Sulfurimonas denitrificans]ABB45371.1 hypothetical protein Suden_2097 [Sulfurimonas denitrificans DSM 1251]MDD3442578.1 hypothetical protein [Sulfurimonas denitrificans]
MSINNLVPLSKSSLESFLKRFDYFRDSELRQIEIISPSVIKITLAAQDSARGFDWITVSLEFSSVSDAKIIENSKLSHIDLGEGITLLYQEETFAFMIGTYNKLSDTQSSICYIKSSSLKYQEGSF